jgi:hypothetical protein
MSEGVAQTEDAKRNSLKQSARRGRQALVISSEADYGVNLPS